MTISYCQEKWGAFREEIIIFSLSLVLIASLIKIFLRPVYFRSGAGARISTIESLVERGTFIIDEATFVSLTPDKVLIDGHFYAGQPPVFSFLSALLYFPLNKFLGLSFAHNPQTCYFILTLFIIGTAYAFLLTFFYRGLNFITSERRIRIVLVTLLGLGTLILPYSTTFNNHTPAASLIFIGFYLILISKFSQPKSNIKANIFAAGTCLGLAATIDIPPGIIYFVIFWGYLLTDNTIRSTLGIFVAGAVPPILLHIILNLIISGHIEPVNIHPEYYQYPGSIFDQSNLSGIITHPDISSLFWYGFHSLVGNRGFFLYTPVLIFSFWMLVKISLTKGHIFHREALSILLGTILIIGFYITKTNNFGGYCYGFRFYIPLIPLIFFFLIFFLQKEKSKLLKGLFLIAVIISFMTTMVGLYYPWSDSSISTNTFLSNMAYISNYHWPQLNRITQFLLLKTTPKNSTMLCRQGDLYFNNHNYYLAKEFYQKAVENNPNSVEAHYKLGQCYQKLGLLEKAKVEFMIAREIDPFYQPETSYELKHKFNNNEIH